MSITAATIMLIYPIGFLFTLAFFKYFGKRIGFDYDPPHPEYYDDWESNSDAYFCFSLFWFIIIPLLMILGIFNLLRNLTKWYLKL